MSDQQTPGDQSAGDQSAEHQSAEDQSAQELYGDGRVPEDADFTDPDDADDPVGDSILDDLPEGGGAEGDLPAGTAGP